MPKLETVLETSLYVDDMQRAAAFYEGTLGLVSMVKDDRLRAYPVGGTVLLLFKRGDTDYPVKLPGGVIPPHDGSGRLHIAFAVSEEELAGWERLLASNAIEIEGRVTWPKGGRSIYFRDPDGHLLELATPGLWENY